MTALIPLILNLAVELVQLGDKLIVAARQKNELTDEQLEAFHQQRLTVMKQPHWVKSTDQPPPPV